MSRIRRILNLIWYELIYGGHLISFGAVSIVLTAAILTDTGITWDFPVVVYLGTQSAYSYNHYREYKKDILTNPERSKHLGTYIGKLPFVIALCILVLLAILLYFNKWPTIVLVLVFLLLGLLYSIALKRFTKRIIAFKTVFLSLCWSSLIILLAVYYSISFDLSFLLIFIFVFLREFVNTSFSDTKDIESDKEEGLLTLPLVLGQKKLIAFLSVINILSIFPIVSGVCLGLFPIYSLLLILAVPYAFYYLNKMNDKKANTAYLYNVIVESEYPFWLVLILVGKTLL